jgi:endo-1,3-1,4-beta-glycanase ExoK
LRFFTYSLNFYIFEYLYSLAIIALSLIGAVGSYCSSMFFRYNDTSEIDIEATQWGWIYSDRLSLSVQPNTYQSAIIYNSPDQCDKNVTHGFDREPTYVRFTAKLANGTTIADWNCTDQTSIPHVAGGVATS